MLRLKKSSERDISSQTKIIRDFNDNYLELTRLLYNAAGLEHLLMLEYLYAAFSIKPEYALVRGTMGTQYYMDTDSRDLLGVAVEEMQHLQMVNNFLTDLGAAPNFEPQELPFSSDIYPFTLELKPLSIETTAQYLFIEASDCALDPICNPEEEKYIAHVYEVLGGHPNYNHLGSLYQTIIHIAELLEKDHPAFLDNRPVPIRWEFHIQNMREIAFQGEIDHYKFFKSVFLASHPGFKGIQVWNYPKDAPEYPSIQFDTVQTTAYPEHPNTIVDPELREIAWLGDLHYWIILALLDVSTRLGNQKERYKAINNMTMALYSIALFLADRGIGIPFDKMSTSPSSGKDPHFTLESTKLLLKEAEYYAQKYHDVLVRAGFNFNVYPITLETLESPIA